MEDKEFRKNYERRLKKFGYKFDGSFENENHKALSYRNNKKDSLIVIVLNKENKNTIASLLFFDGMKSKAKYDVNIDELFKYLEEEAWCYEQWSWRSKKLSFGTNKWAV